MAYVFDSSAVLTLLFEERNHQQITDLLREAARDGGTRILLPFVALMEVEYRLLRSRSRGQAEAALALVDAWPATVVESTVRWRHGAAQVKARGGLSLADAWIAALALEVDATLVHKDPEFERIADLRTRFIS